MVHGANKWVNLYKYNNTGNNTLNCINSLKEKGYSVYGTSPHTNDYSIQELPIDNKIALVFGTEKEGLSDIAKKNVDGFVKIPMVGFSESLNISVSAAICFYEITKRIKSSDNKWQLSDDEKILQLINWSKKVISRSDIIEKEFLKQQ